MSTVFERPLIDRRDLLDRLGSIRPESDFEWLRHRGLLSQGIAVPPVTPQRPDVPALVMSALNREVITAVKADDLTLAAEISHAATQLEQELREWIRHVDLARREAHGSNPFDRAEALSLTADAEQDGDRPEMLGGLIASRWSRETLRWASDDAPEFLSQLAGSAAALEQTRAEFRGRLPLVQTTLCRVWRIGEIDTELRPLDGSTGFSFLSREILDAGLTLGDAAAVRHEEVAPGTVVTDIDPAVDVTRRGTSLSGRRLSGHIGSLLSERRPPERAEKPSPLRRVA